MTKATQISAVLTFALLAVPLAASADSGHAHQEKGSSKEGQHGELGGHGDGSQGSASLADAWTALIATRDAIAADIENGELGDVHERAEPLPNLVTTLLEQSRDLDTKKRARVEGAAKQVARVADALHVAADRGDGDRSRKELSKLDGLLELIRVQYPKGALEPEGHGEHAHMEAPAGVVDASTQVTVVVKAFDELHFEPRTIQVTAGSPTRIQLENVGSAAHALVVKTPDGTRDWVHLHAPPGATESAVYQLDKPGTYLILCTLPGHTEGGMVGELVVVAKQGTTKTHIQ